jgi:hypothetical protein
MPQVPGGGVNSGHIHRGIFQGGAEMKPYETRLRPRQDFEPPDETEDDDAEDQEAGDNNDEDDQ